MHWVTGIIATGLAAFSGLFLSNVLGPQRQALASDGAQRNAIYAPSAALTFSTSQVLVRPPITPTPGVTLLDMDDLRRFAVVIGSGGAGLEFIE